MLPTALLALAALLAGCRAASPRQSEARVCQTSECLALSAFITSSMNASADPCEDFDAYACGNFRLNTLYDPATVSWSKTSPGELLLSVKGLDEVRKRLSKRIFELLLFPQSLREQDPDIAAMNQLSSSLFRSCASWVQRRRTPGRSADDSEREASKILLNGILEHLVESFSPRTQPDWFERALAKMVRFGIWPFLDIMPSLEVMYSRSGVPPNVTRVRLVHELGRAAFPAAAVRNYTAFLSSLSAASSFDFNDLDAFVGVDRTLKETVVENGTESAKILKWRECASAKSMLQPGNLACDLAIRDLNEVSKCAESDAPFDWSAFFDAVLDGSVDKGERIQFGTRGRAIDIIKIVSYFKKQANSGSKVGKFNAHFTYLMLDWMLRLSPYYSKAFATSVLGNKPFNIPPMEVEDPVGDCMLLTKRMLAPVVERMFLRSHHDGTFDRVRRLVDRVQNATIDSVRRQAWITPGSKEAIIDKISSLKKEIGFDNVPDAKLKAFYASTARSLRKTNKSETYRDFGLLFSHAMCAYAGRQNNLLSSSRSVSESVFAFTDSLTVNAFSALLKNQIIFPMGILSPTIYHRSYPEYINLGGIGVVIGHEIGHGFDNLGHQLTKLGSRGHFWDNHTETGYLERMRCVESRYNSYEIVRGRRHNSNLTVGNDISDLMGIQAAYGALKLLSDSERLLRLPNLPESLTPERLFFVQAAQTWCDKSEPGSLLEIYRQSKHSPSHIRIRGMMENSKEFAAAFQCRPGQAMNPASKCEFW